MPAQHLQNSIFMYAVTNRHVIESGNTVVRFNTMDGGVQIADIVEMDWVFHPEGDDAALAPLTNTFKQIRCTHIPESMLLFKEEMDRINIGIGDDVYVLGRFINHEGRQQNTPSLRFGNIAQMPQNPIRQTRGEGYFDQESFLVEARSNGGFSGSPVIVMPNPASPRPDRPGIIADRVYVLGVDWGHLNDWQPVHGTDRLPMGFGQQVRIDSGMMTVAPAWKLHDLLHIPQLEVGRANAETLALAERGLPISTIN